jgi:hypothetical protein
MTEAKKEEIGYAWNFAADLGNGRQFSLSGNFPKGVDAAIMNAEVDKVRSVFDRQQAQSAMRNLDEEIEVDAITLKNLMEDLNRVDDKNKAKGSLSASERQERSNTVANIERMSQRIEHKQSILNKLKAEAK